MKKYKLFTFSVLICLLLVSCASGITEDNISQGASLSTSDVENASGYDIPISRQVSLVPMSNKITISASNAETITDEECEEMAKNIISDIYAIAREFYGKPTYLLSKSNSWYDGMPYDEVVLNSLAQETSLVFENDADALKELLSTYFTERLIKEKFSLEKPCPIYEDKESGKLYRIVYADTPHGGNTADVAAGRILSRENGVVKYGFPMYWLNRDTNEPDLSVWFLGHIDFVYENGSWKVDDFYVSNAYSTEHLPGNTQLRMDDFFEFDETFTAEGISATLSDGTNVTLNVNGKEITAELEVNSGGISKIEKIGENVFVSFRGAFEKDETLILSESGEFVGRFSANSYTATENGDWYYVILDPETFEGDVYNKSGDLLVNFVVPRQEEATQFVIAPIQNFELNEEGFTVVYDNMDK